MVTKIMALGDSLTMGVQVSGSNNTDDDDNGTGGYRFPLWNSLVGNGFDIDFVGTLSPSNTANPDAPLTFDSEHLGLRRWTIDQLLDGDGPASSIANITSPVQNVDTWMTQYQPDIVLLMIGTNDMILQNQSVDGAIAELESVVRKIVAAGSTVLVASPPPLNLNAVGPLNGSLQSGEDGAIAAYAAKVPELVNTLQTELGTSVRYVDVFNAINPSTDLGSDGLHLKDSAYTKVAQEWYNALVPLLPSDGTIRSRGDLVTVEAEDFTTIDSQYQTDIVSGPEATILSLAHLRPSNASPNISASASFNWQGVSGQYDLILNYFDESDGAGQYQISIGDTVISTFTTSQDSTLGTSPRSQNYTSKTAATSVDISNGDRITVTFLTDKGESRSFDNIQLVRLGDILPSETAGGGTDGTDGGTGGTDGSTGGTDGGTSGTDGGTDGGTGGSDDGTGGTGETDGGTGGTDGSTGGTDGTDNVVVGEVADPLPQPKFKGNKGVRLQGTQKKDALQGGKKNDFLKGNNGNDKLAGKGGNDRAFGGKGHDRLIGSGGDDYLRGDQGKDTLLGGGGNDLLWGGNDNNGDILKGGGGQDAYLFQQLSDTPDTIVGFQTGDVIDIRAILSGAQYGEGTGFEKYTQFVQRVQVGGNTVVQIDSDGTLGEGTFKTLVVLQGVQVDVVQSTDFVI